jgi:NAD(P)-dependent dehydrogenase (short-subunit alcohol dehydrogenase family)
MREVIARSFGLAIGIATRGLTLREVDENVTGRKAPSRRVQPAMSALLSGRVALVTGAGRGIGRAEALELARRGAHVLVNNASADPAEEVVEEIRSAGGNAESCAGDVGDWDVAAALVDHCLSTFGRLDVVVNNAGIVRDRMLVSMTKREWDEVIHVHVGGTAALTHHAAVHWRAQHRAGAEVDARIINTTSLAGLLGHVGQSNYAAAKAAVVGLTLTAADELSRYRVTVNAIGPGARTRMTAALSQSPVDDRDWDPYAPENVAPLVAWLASAEAREVTGQVFGVHGGEIVLYHGWRPGAVSTRNGPWEAQTMASVVGHLMEQVEPRLTVNEVLRQRRIAEGSSRGS